MNDDNRKLFNHEIFEEQALPKLDNLRVDWEVKRRKIVDKLRLLKSQYEWELNRVKEFAVDKTCEEDLDKIIDKAYE